MLQCEMFTARTPTTNFNLRGEPCSQSRETGSAFPITRYQALAAHLAENIYSGHALRVYAPFNLWVLVRSPLRVPGRQREALPEQRVVSFVHRERRCDPEC